MSDLVQKRCKPCEGGAPPLKREEIAALMPQLAARWTLAADGKSIAAQFEFKNYYQTQAFVNAVAWLAHREDHHPDISFGYKTARVSYWTHSVDGLSENDFICAAKVDALLRE